MAADPRPWLRACLHVGCPIERCLDGSTQAEALARRFHETYERLAPSFGYKTREASAVPWADVPAQNKSLMIAVAAAILMEIPDDPDVSLG